MWQVRLCDVLSGSESRFCLAQSRDGKPDTYMRSKVTDQPRHVRDEMSSGFRLGARVSNKLGAVARQCRTRHWPVAGPRPFSLQAATRRASQDVHERAMLLPPLAAGKEPWSYWTLQSGPGQRSAAESRGEDEGSGSAVGRDRKGCRLDAAAAERAVRVGGVAAVSRKAVRELATASRPGLRGCWAAIHRAGNADPQRAPTHDAVPR